MDDPLSIWDTRYANPEESRVTPKDDCWMDRWSNLLDKEKGEMALDIGCGIGLDTRYLGQLGYKVVSIDLSGEALTICSKASPDPICIQANIGQGLPFETNSFQIVSANLSLHYFTWTVTQKILKDIHGCLKKGGLFLTRLNSTNDTNFGSVGHKEIEPNLFLVHGEQKRFFDIGAVKELFNSGWKFHGVQEMCIDRYSKPKVAWEVIAENV
jgi:SAM-dependent methyltransferase